jgi:hypothetical protein
MRLEKPAPGSDVFTLTMSPGELAAVNALAKFARAGIAYDAHAAYVAQVFVYIFLQPRDLVGDHDTQRAFMAVDQLCAQPKPGDGDVVLRLPKAEMRQLLMIVSMAAESEDRSEVIHDGKPDEFPHGFPDLKLPASYYAKALDDLLNALYEGTNLTA